METAEATQTTESTETQVIPHPTPLGNPVIRFDSMESLLTKGKKAVAAVPTPETEKTPEPASEPAKDATKEQPKEPAKDPIKGTKDENMANMRKALEEAKKQAEELKALYDNTQKEYAEYKLKPLELPEEHKIKLTALETERNQYLQELRAVRIEKDPEFVDKYVKPIQSSIATMQKVAIDAGVDEATLKAGFARWDENAFGDWIEGMNPGQKAKFSAAWMEAERMEQERISKITDSNKTWEEMQKSREEAMKREQAEHLSQNEKMAKDLVKQIIIDNEGYKTGYDDLLPAAEAIAMKAARYELSPKEVFENVIANQALSRVTVRLNETIKEKDAALAERDKKIEELEAFVAQQSGATPRPSATGGNGKVADDSTPVWNRIVVRT